MIERNTTVFEYFVIGFTVFIAMIMIHYYVGNDPKAVMRRNNLYVALMRIPNASWGYLDRNAFGTIPTPDNYHR